MSANSTAGIHFSILRDLTTGLVATALLAISFYAAIVPFYQGNATTLFLFVFSGVLLFGLAVVLRPSFFLVVLASFLTLGFLLKTVAHLSFGVPLIEPVGDFSGSAFDWDMALKFAAAGQFGGIAAIVLASFIPSRSSATSDEVIGRGKLKGVLFRALAILIVCAIGVYALNYRYAIMRIGYPLGIDLHPRLYAVLAFTISWGALLGGLAIVQWLIELGGLGYVSLILLASFLGFFSSVTMGSRIQFLLYVLASMCIILRRGRSVQHWAGILAALCIGGLLFVLSIAVVSVERNYAFQSDKTVVQNQDTATLARKFEVVSSDHGRLGGVLQELRSLALMRWVGLEGVLTAEGAKRELGSDLLIRGLKEDPAVGKNGIYQKMAGDLYGKVEFFTFLTLPGTIGFASYSGSVPVIFGLVFGAIIIGHLVEWFAFKMTGNIAVAAVSGVSLAYLTVQMGFPWTLFVYAVELCLACAALRGFWLTIRWLVTSQRSAQLT
jgi:hypothetical protein